MFSDRAIQSRAVILLGLLLAFTLACGRKGNPTPPPRKNPATTNDLTVAQRGSDLLLSLTYPSMTAGGLALAGIDEIEVWQYTRPAPELMEIPLEVPLGEAEAEETEEPAPEAVEPALPEASEPIAPEGDEPEVVVEDLRESAEGETLEETGAEVAEGAPTEGAEEDTAEEVEEPAEADPFLRIMIDPKEFDKQSKSILVLQDTELENAVVGGKIQLSVPLAEITTEPPTAYGFAVRTASGRLRSERSRPTGFAPQPAPETPKDLEVSPTPTGVVLTWTPLEDESQIEGYAVYRRLAQSAEFTTPLTMVTSGDAEYDDRSARFGSQYVYAIAAVKSRRPMVESLLSEERSLDYKDVFPPPQPTGLVALAEAGRVRLLWNAGRGRDTAGYLIFARRGDGEEIQLTETPIKATEFVHEDATSGATYVYTVRSVDNAGNQSDPSDPATTRVP